MYLLDLIGTLAFSVSGAFKAKSRKINIFGVVTLGIITAIGGGTTRDLIIGRTPLFYLIDENYLIVAVIAALATYIFPNFFSYEYSLFRFLDSVGIAAFAIIGGIVTKQHLSFEWSVFTIGIMVTMGVFTACGGGVIRDTIMGDTPYAFKEGSNYITAALLGSVVFSVLDIFNTALAITVSIVTTLIIREIFSPFGFLRFFILKKRGELFLFRKNFTPKINQEQLEA